MVPAVNSVVEFLYPIENEIGRRPRLRLRRLLVRSIRDLLTDPLRPEDFSRRPFVRRGTLLLTGLDLDKMEERSFYLDWARRVEFVIHHRDGEPTKIRCGKSRCERACFGDICRQLADCNGVAVKPRATA